MKKFTILWKCEKFLTFCSKLKTQNQSWKEIGWKCGPCIIEWKWSQNSLRSHPFFNWPSFCWRSQVSQIFRLETWDTGRLLDHESQNFRLKCRKMLRHFLFGFFHISLFRRSQQLVIARFSNINQHTHKFNFHVVVWRWRKLKDELL